MTDEEAIGGLVKLGEGKGFFPRHSNIMLSMLKQYRKGRKITDSQLNVIKKNLNQYRMGKIKPVQNNVPQMHATLYKKYFRISSVTTSELKKELKSLGESIWEDETDTYLVSINYWTVQKLKKISIGLSEELNIFLEEHFEYEKLPVKKLKGLRGYQNEGVSFCMERKGRALIADDMGLGKTIQGIGYLKVSKQLPAIVICPSSVKYNWQREINKWMPSLTTKVLEGRSTEKLEEFDIYIINFDILSKMEEYMTKPRSGGKPTKKKKEIGWIKELLKVNPLCVIIDEAQVIQNKKTLLTKACLKLCAKSPSVIGLTGTPISSKPAQFWTIINAIHPCLFPKWKDFGQRYCGPKWNGFAYTYKGSTNEKELHKVLTDTIMIRRLKKDVELELPERQTIVLPMKMTDHREYEKALRDFRLWAKANPDNKAEALIKIEKIKRGVAMAKLHECCIWIDDMLDTGRKLVVFAHHKCVIDYVTNLFKGECVSITGSVPAKEREGAVLEFQHDPDVRLFVGNLKAAGTGITLTAASDVAFLELGWTPTLMDQCIDRVHRYGQKNDCMAWYLLVEDTIEMEIAELLDEKRKVVTAIVDGKKAKSSDLITEMMRRI